MSQDTCHQLDQETFRMLKGLQTILCTAHIARPRNDF